MLFAVRYHPRNHISKADWKDARTTFLKWQPPFGVEVVSHYHFVSNDGVIIVESSSPAALYEGTVPFAQTFKIRIEPTVKVIDALAVSMDFDESVAGDH